MKESPLVLGLDLEGINKDLIGSGVNLQTDRVIEIGAVLVDWDTLQPVKILSELIDEVDRLELSEEVIELTGINERHLKNWGLKGEGIRSTLNELSKLFHEADYILAHNGDGYDKPMIHAMFQRYDISFDENKLWIDSSKDIEFPKKFSQRSLAMLEHYHGFINPMPHRALADVFSTIKIASQYNLERIIKLAQSPRKTLIADLNAPNWKNKKEVEVFNTKKNIIAKSGFKWNPKDKNWELVVQELLINENRLSFPFEWYIKDESK